MSLQFIPTLAANIILELVFPVTNTFVFRNVHTPLNSCSDRLHHLRKQTGLVWRRKQGKNAPIFQSRIENTKIMEILLLLAERTWACAEQLSRENSTNEAHKTQHALARYKKAELHARRLRDACAVSADPETLTEARAYFDWIAGNLALKVNNWRLALCNFLYIRVFLQLLGNVGSSSHRAFLMRMFQDVDQKIQYFVMN
ncbi:MAG: hypothetical protein EZS28_013536 [Streblomastix strix]|uniref:Signal recognition particle subunit SRP68 n=1 Tax=Streblomastix strix TaxID=222440 RepID=A0A5J4W8H4_9EUKA|nr:MAG: hypothetical protein EZS28_013536 [Streblomastix strix]